MSSRVERFAKTKARHAKRMKKYMKKWGSTSRGQFGSALQPCPHWTMGDGPKQMPLVLTIEQRIAQRPPWPATNPPFWEVIPGGPRKFRVLRILPAFYLPGQGPNYNSDGARFEVHHRRRRIVPHKPGRKDKTGRKVWASSLSHLLFGYYIDGDPEGRHPQEEEVFRLDNPLDGDPPGTWG